ncbi:HAD-IIB family hydrolase [Pelagibius litoralis]|uniref:HAD-IIB family hydrolase n=1 Tax=Pelagibius litoralis TaxID=374515 RepID=A0A967K9Y7_9PROT|nr:HAD-IIB family hydrolase [Pelagibius litoralis]NIA70182.1 HAD-IIB family hydrolase [Pelagibius litoralis]
MRPLADFPLAARRALRFVLADIDDTVTEDGRLPSASLAAMERLSAAGLHVVPVTGRPAGWCDHIARMWPVDAVVGENGAFYFAYDRTRRQMLQSFAKTPAERETDRQRLKRLRERILGAVPGAGIASDQDYRIADLAIDFCEDVAPLSKEDIGRIVAIFEDEGATAKVSSIHVNGWFGSYDKLSMTRRCLAERFGIDMEAARAEIVFAGDSPNDQPMFAYFENAIGVANVRDFDLATPPNWITRQRSAAGFQELADAILEAR